MSLADSSSLWLRPGQPKPCFIWLSKMAQKGAGLIRIPTPYRAHNIVEEGDQGVVTFSGESIPSLRNRKWINENSEIAIHGDIDEVQFSLCFAEPEKS